MKFYKKLNGVHAFESDGSQDFLITSDFVKMSADEVDRHVNPEKYLPEVEKYNLYISRLPKLSKNNLD